MAYIILKVIYRKDYPQSIQKLHWLAHENKLNPQVEVSTPSTAFFKLKASTLTELRNFRSKIKEVPGIIATSVIKEQK